ncbi:MAG: hypothetical protein HOP24_00645 [Sideroxydans sp.]|jgi:hypothetical protein|nr:hypothetical protein [Sideroxydans sp.]
MHLINNRLITLLVAFSVAFASLWAMSPDAIADAIKEDTTAYLHQEVQSTHQNQNKHEHVAQSQQCNHGCHMAFHLLGFAENTSTNVFAFNEPNIDIPYAKHLFESPLLQGLYRPPLTLSLV